MADAVFYCKIADVERFTIWEFKPGVIYAIPNRIEYNTKIFRAISSSDKVWIQGTRGGVRVAKDMITRTYGYITKNEELMKEFMWVKLKAQPLPNYT